MGVLPLFSGHKGPSSKTGKGLHSGSGNLAGLSFLQAPVCWTLPLPFFSVGEMPSVKAGKEPYPSQDRESGPRASDSVQQWVGTEVYISLSLEQFRSTPQGNSILTGSGNPTVVAYFKYKGTLRKSLCYTCREVTGFCEVSSLIPVANFSQGTSKL